MTSTAVEVHDEMADHSLGPASAVVTVVEYGDFQCPECRRAVPAVKLLFKHFRAPIRFVYRHYPLEHIHLHALDAALAAEAAAAQGCFWPMHDLLFRNQPRLALPQLQGYAEQLDLDVPRFCADLERPAYLARVRSHIDRARRSGVRGAPAFFVDDRIVDVSFGLQRLFDAVGRALHSAAPRRAAIPTYRATPRSK